MRSPGWAPPCCSPHAPHACSPHPPHGCCKAARGCTTAKPPVFSSMPHPLPSPRVLRSSEGPCPAPAAPVGVAEQQGAAPLQSDAWFPPKLNPILPMEAAKHQGAAQLPQCCRALRAVRGCAAPTLPCLGFPGPTHLTEGEEGGHSTQGELEHHQRCHTGAHQRQDARQHQHLQQLQRPPLCPDCCLQLLPCRVTGDSRGTPGWGCPQQGEGEEGAAPSIPGSPFSTHGCLKQLLQMDPKSRCPKRSPKRRSPKPNPRGRDGSLLQTLDVEINLQEAAEHRDSTGTNQPCGDKQQGVTVSPHPRGPVPPRGLSPCSSASSRAQPHASPGHAGSQDPRENISQCGAAAAQPGPGSKVCGRRLPGAGKSLPTELPRWVQPGSAAPPAPVEGKFGQRQGLKCSTHILPRPPGIAAILPGPARCIRPNPQPNPAARCADKASHRIPAPSPSPPKTLKLHRNRKKKNPFINRRQLLRPSGRLLLHHLPELVPKEEAEHGVGAEAEVDSTDALVQAQQPLLAGDLHKAVPKPPVQLALRREEAAAAPRWTHPGVKKKPNSPKGLTAPSASTGWL